MSTEENGGRLFVPITNKDVYIKLLEIEKELDVLKIKVYAGAGAASIVTTVLVLIGGVTIGT